MQASDIKQKIEGSLKRRAEVETEAVRVTVLYDKITLDGKVHNWDERELVEDAAGPRPGSGSSKII